MKVPFGSRIKSLILTLPLFVLCTPIFAENNITFPNACAKGESIIIAAVGDVLIHTPLRLEGSKKGYEVLWQEAIPYFKTADITYANLEGPIAAGVSEPGYHGKDNIYTDFPYFNYPPRLATSLKNSGITIVSTANNHALDRYAIGIDKTIETLKKAGIAHTGTNTRGSHDSWFYITTKKNIKIAWISCTEHTNGIDDTYKQILYCYKKKDRQWIIKTINELKSTVDAIIVLPHWGEEYQHHPNDEQITFAHQVLNAGATMVIGSHPHVLQPLQKYLTKDGRTTLIMYSLGNFVSHQAGPDKRSTVILLLGLTKTTQGTFINGVRFVPMYMQNRGSTNIHLSRIPNDTRDADLMRVIARVMPMGNVLYSTTIVTNPQCSTFTNNQKKEPIVSRQQNEQ